MAWRPFLCMETLDSNLIQKKPPSFLQPDKSPPKIISSLITEADNWCPNNQRRLYCQHVNHSVS